MTKFEKEEDQLLQLIDSLFGEVGDNKFDAIYIDPPWEYKGKKPPTNPVGNTKQIESTYYYPTLHMRVLEAFPIRDLCNKNAVLFMWTTTPLLPEALDLAKKWGFKYKTVVTWEKLDKDCMGYWFRVCTEHLIVATVGDVKAFRSMERTCFNEKRRKHSQKPEYFYNLIESVVQGSKLEMFARNKRDGWVSWGNEPNKY